MLRPRKKDLFKIKVLTKTEKIELLLLVCFANDGKILFARDFYFHLMVGYPEESKQFSGPIEVGKLLEQTTIESVKQSTTPKIYFCSDKACMYKT